MARGMVVGEAIQSQAGTEQYREGYDLAFGKDRKPVRGRWVATPDGLVPVEEYVPPARALDAPIMVDRFYEGTVSPIDGADIGSRRKRRDYMKARDLVDHADAKSEARIVQKDFQKAQDRERHEALRRAVYEHTEKRRNRR